MIWRRLRKSTPEEEEDFKKRMTEEKVPLKDKLLMILTAYVVIVIPCLLFLVGLSALVLWIFRII